MFPGIADRMQKELTALAPSSAKVCLSLRCSQSCCFSDLKSDGLVYLF